MMLMRQFFLLQLQKSAKNLKKGKIRLAFQPAEESLQGALAMIKDGVLDGVDIVVGSHIRPVQDLPFRKYCSVRESCCLCNR